ncbi:MAG TPA: XRE family transcriptional regulator [Xanthobacteraceae bacterium]
MTTCTIEALARVLHTTPTWLLQGKGEEEPAPLERGVVLLAGYVDAGARTTFFSASQGPFDEVQAPENATRDTVAVEVRGESLGAFFDRWLVYYDDVRRPVTNDLLNKLCVVGLVDGPVLIKKLHRSRAKGLSHLISQSEGPIFDVEVDWAARVTEMRPR